MRLLKSYRTLKSGEPAYKVNSLFEELAYHENFREHSTMPIEKFIFDRFNETYENIKYYQKE